VGGWFDSHCHVQEEYLGGAKEAAKAGADPLDLASVVERARRADVDRLVCIGTGVATSQQAVDVARSLTGGDSGLRAWASIGLHPHEASEGIDGVAALLARQLAVDAAPDDDAAPVDDDDDDDVVGGSVVVAVGECGLDYYYEHSPRPAQRRVFAAQIALAHAHNVALIIHARDAWDDLFDILEAEGVPARTVLHCFTGGPDEVDRCLRAGMYVSFSGIITFKNAADVRAAASRCPLDRLLVETDSPFLAPVPHRGRANEPSYLPLVGAAVAEVKGCAVEEVKESSAAAAAMVFATLS
jgi:TatD DNase family protein